MAYRIVAMFALLSGLLLNTVHAEEKLKADTTKSKIEFVGKKSDGEHSGGFKKFAAEASVVEDAPEKSSLKITIDTESLFSDDQRLTAHLKNPDFFDVKKYPTITFESKKIEMKDAEQPHATIIGMLTMLGKEETLEVPVSVEADEDQIVVVAKFKLDRSKWGMTYGQGKVNNDVDITATLHFDR